MSDQDEAEDHLSEEEIDQQFREVADKFIDLANGQAAEYFRGQYQSMLDKNMRNYREAFETLPYAHLMPDKPN